MIPFQIVVSGLLEGSIYSLLALGLSLVIGVMRLVNIVHGDLLILGGFVSFWLFQLYGVDPYLSLVLTIPLFFGIGAFLQKVIIEPGIKNAEHYTAASMIITYALALAIVQGEFLLWSANYRAIDTSYVNSTFTIFGQPFDTLRLGAFGASMLAAVILYYILAKTFVGKAMRASRDDREVAQMMGVNFSRLSAYTFGLSSAIAALAAVMYITTHSMNPGNGLLFTVKAYAALILGGLGSIWGPVLAGIILGMSENIGSYYIGSNLKDTISFAVLLAILIIRPTGIFGKQEV